MKRSTKIDTRETPDDDLSDKLSRAEIDEIGNHIKLCIEDSMSQMSTRFDRIRQWSLQFDAPYIPKDFPWPGSSSLNIPKTRSIVEGLVAQTQRALTDTSPYVRVEASDDEEDLDDATDVERLLYFQCVEEINWEAICERLLTFGYKMANGIGLVKWKRTMGRRSDVEPKLVDESGDVTTDLAVGKPVLHPLTGEPVMHIVKRDRVIEDRPCVEVIHPLDFVPYPATTTSNEWGIFDRAIGLSHRVWLTANDIKKGVRDGMYDSTLAADLIDNTQPTGEPWNDESGNDETTSALSGIDGMAPRQKADQPYEMFHCLWQWDVDGDGIEEDIEITIERHTGAVIRIWNYPYWHGRRNYLNFCPIPRDRSWAGYSECEIIEHLAGEVNAIRNQRIDCGSLALAPMLKVKETVRRDPNRPWWIPGAILKVQDPNDAQIMAMPGVGQQAFAEQNLVVEDMQDVSGMNAYALGQSPSRSRTAGEVSQVVAAGNEKLNIKIGHCARVFKELMRQVLALDYQFLPPELEHAIIGSPGRGLVQLPQPGMGQPTAGEQGPAQPQPPVRLFNKISRDQLNKGYRLHVVGNTANTNKELMIQAAETLYQMSQTSPLIQIDAVRLWNVLYNYLQQVGIVDPTPYIGTEAQARQFQLDKLQQQPQVPMQPITLSGKIDELTSMSLVLQKDPSLAPFMQQVINMYVAAERQAAAQEMAQGVGGATGQQGAGQPPYIPTDPNRAKIQPETVQNQGVLDHVIARLSGPQGGPQNGQQ